MLAAPYALNPEYTANYALEQEIDGVLRERADMTMGGEYENEGFYELVTATQAPLKV